MPSPNYAALASRGMVDPRRVQPAMQRPTAPIPDYSVPVDQLTALAKARGGTFSTSQLGPPKVPPATPGGSYPTGYPAAGTQQSPYMAAGVRWDPATRRYVNGTTPTPSASNPQPAPYQSQPGQPGQATGNYNLPIPTNNPVGGPTNPTSSLPTTLADFARQTVQSGVQNPAKLMYHDIGALGQMSTPSDRQANMALGQRWQNTARAHNLQNMNVTLSTAPLDEQLNRYIMAAMAGVDQVGLLRQQQNLGDQYGLAQMQRAADAARMIMGAEG